MTTTAKHWAADLIGTRWAPGAQGPDAFDCRGLVRHVVRERLEADLPEVETAHGSKWRPVEGEPAHLDVVLMRGPEGRHIGVMVYGNGMLGVLHACGTVNARGRCEGSVIFQTLAEATAGGYHAHTFWRYEA